ncbi:MAG: 2-oxoacid:acceptor oxidoreductase family protein [Bacillota bacterium]
MKREYTIAGFGGQGILYLGQVMAYAAMIAGRETCWIPSYGPEMRGGTANCSVVISDERIRSPLVDSPDTVLIFNKPSFEMFAPRVRSGGTVILVSELIDNPLEREDVFVYRVPAKTLAAEAGQPQGLNMVLLGALVAVDASITYDDVAAAIRKATPAHRQKMVEGNLAAVKKGLDYVSGLKNGPAAGSKKAGAGA